MPYYKTLKVVILGFDGVLGSALTGALDLFSFTGVSWQRFLEQAFCVLHSHGLHVFDGTHCNARLKPSV